jgi:phosphoribosylglycinamide formyltransferase-1
MSEGSDRPRLAVLISGGGRTLLNLQDRIEAGSLSATIPLVIAGRECPGAERARERGLEVRIVPGEIPGPALDCLLRQFEIDWVVLAGYLKKVDIPPVYNQRVVNIHPALLPKYGGPGMYGHRVHEAVLAAGESVSGCTVHLCDGGYDTGPIILQRSCPVLPGDTPESLAARVFALELEAYPEALQLLFGRTVHSERP